MYIYSTRNVFDTLVAVVISRLCDHEYFHHFDLINLGFRHDSILLVS